MNDLLLRWKMMMGAASQLQGAYTRLSYIACSSPYGTSYIIDTGVALTQREIHGNIVYASYGVSLSQNSGETVIGGHGAGWSGGFRISGSRLICENGGAQVVYVSTDALTSLDFWSYDFSINNSGTMEVVAQKISGGTPVSSANAAGVSGNTNGGTIALFGVNVGSSPVGDQGRYAIKEVTLWDGAQTAVNKVSCIWPAIRNSDNQPGFRDEVRDIFIPVDNGWIIGPVA